MEFLDEQGVQPCGHKAREKGMIIKVFASCKSNEIPTEYRFSVGGMLNDENTGWMSYWASKELLETQTTDHINSSLLNCDSQTIAEPCTLPPGLTWWRIEEIMRVEKMRKKSSISSMVLTSGSISKIVQTVT